MSHEKEPLLNSQPKLREKKSLLPTVISQKVDREFYQKICDKLMNDAEDQDGFDIYQMTAFLHYYHRDKTGSTMKYLFYCFKCIICCLIQTIGMLAFLYNVIMTEDESVLECTLEAPLELNILATLFSLYISVQMVGMIKVLKNDGLYEHVAFAPPFLCAEWIYIGLYSNFFTLLCCIYGSFLVIYVSDNALDIVLNSVALYFIMDLDNLMVDHFDYVRIKKWMKDEFIFEQYFDDDWYNEQEGDVRFIHLFGMIIQISGRKGGCGKCRACWVFIGGLFTYFAMAIGIIGAFVAPIAIAVCY